MKISIITTVFNNKETISEAIESVLMQTYDDIEYIVVDGKSSDGTIDIIKQYQGKITSFVSETDEGLYEGLNKGLSLASGDVVGFLHSDDLYYHSRVVENVMRAFIAHQVDSVYGNLVYVKKKDTRKVVRYWNSGEFSIKKLHRGWMPPHPTFFVKRDIYRKYGVFDTNFRIAADYDIILRFLGKHKISTYYISDVFIKMRVGGESNRSLGNIFKKSKDDFKAMKNNKIGHIGSLFFKNISKIPQFLRRK